MTPSSRLPRLLLTGLAVGLSLGSMGLASVMPTLAQSRAQSSNRRSRVKFTMPRLSYDRGAPSNRGDGASRNDFCGLASKPIAITPQYSETAVSASGNATQRHFILTQTSEPKPTFGLHLPLGQQDIADLQLTLFVEDTAGNPVYDLPIAAPNEAGIITFQPGPSQPNLQEGQRYNWAIEIEVLCSSDEVEQAKFITLTGQIERRPLFQDSASISPEEYAIIAAERGFWPETMTAVADLNRSDRSNGQYVADWATMLEDIGLEALTMAPLSKTTQLLSPQGQANPPEMINLIAQPQRSSSRLFPVR